MFVAVLTRAGRLSYLQRTMDELFKQHTGEPIHIALWVNGTDDFILAWVEKNRSRLDWIHVAPHNVGQHVAMNEMIDQAVKLGMGWFIRMDDDAWTKTPRQWIKRLLKIQYQHRAKFGHFAILGPKVEGLRAPPPTLHTGNVPAGSLEQVSMLGGICRMAPMSLLRYFRFNERMPMGGSEALQLADFCASKHVPILRDVGFVVSHGDSTDAQESANPDWTYEHAMLQVIPYGL